MALQPNPSQKIDRSTTSPFLLRLFWRPSRTFNPDEFSIAPPQDTSAIPDYSSLLPAYIRQQSVQIYTWPSCTLGELTGLLTSVLPADAVASLGGGGEGSSAGGGNGGLSVGTRLVYKLIFPDTRAQMGEGGRGRWIEKALGSVVIGGGRSGRSLEEEQEEDAAGAGSARDGLDGDAEKTLADARFVIGDYVACTIYAPGQDARAAPGPRGGRGPRDGGYSRGPPMRENGYDGPGYGGGRAGGGGYRGRGYGRGGGGYGNFGGPPPMNGDWRRGERPPGGGGDGGYRRGGRPY